MSEDASIKRCECGSPMVVARGLCMRCYQRQRRSENPTPKLDPEIRSDIAREAALKIWEVEAGEDWLTIAQAAEAKGVCEDAIEKALKRGALESRMVGRRRLVSREALQRWRPRKYPRKS